ncbi:hypothetical protein CMI42_01645 [Candidatus Pacearchaeota archaeon]|nr:hypothetical protein [Candidatus Pacearchaeota archaeon]|tara:strand:- start:755 stop:1963 length:1209 start_codon:yes stop_codon:yes gene_type:complete
MASTIEILKKWNIWDGDIDSGKKRTLYIDKIWPVVDRKEVIVLKGIRRSGKSTIMKQLMKKLVNSNINKKQILYLNLEDYGFADSLNLELFDNVLSSYLNYTKNKKLIYFFIDEIQKIPDWAKWVRTKYELKDKIKFIVSGSSASLLTKELSTLLTGRNLSFLIKPLSYQEYMKFASSPNIRDYITYGGFPEVVLENNVEKKIMLLTQYFEDIIHKDIIDRYSVRNSKQLLDLTRNIVLNAGTKVSINKLSKIYGLSTETIATYIGYMVNAFLLIEVTYFSFSELIKYDKSKLPKYYSIDNGFITITNQTYSENRGKKYENAVLLKLWDGKNNISYWNELSSEVDFIIDGKAINVTSTNDIPDREQKGLINFKSKYKNFNLILVSDSIKKDNIIGMHEFLVT